jgi:hypothetical protein
MINLRRGVLNGGKYCSLAVPWATGADAPSIASSLPTLTSPAGLERLVYVPLSGGLVIAPP